MKYSVVTFGCRVNQADSLGFEEELLARGAVAVAAGSSRSRRREHVLGDGHRRSGRTADHSPDRARQPGRPDRRHGLLRDAAAGRDRARCRTSSASSPTTTSRASFRLIADDCGLTTAARLGRETARAEPRSNPVSPAAPASRYASRPDAREQCSYCIIPVDAGAAAERAVGGDTRRSPADLGRWIQRDRADRRSPRVVRPRPDRLLRHSSNCCAPSKADRPAASSSASARSNRWTVRARSSSSSRDGCFAPHFHLPLQHASDRHAGGDVPSLHDRVLRVARGLHPRADTARVDRLGCDRRISRTRRTTTSTQLVSYLERSPLTHVHVFPYSDRPGTAATSMSGKVPGAVVRERGRRIREVAARLAERFPAIARSEASVRA